MSRDPRRPSSRVRFRDRRRSREPSTSPVACPATSSSYVAMASSGATRASSDTMRGSGSKWSVERALREIDFVIRRARREPLARGDAEMDRVRRRRHVDPNAKPSALVGARGRPSGRASPHGVTPRATSTAAPPDVSRDREPRRSAPASPRRRARVLRARDARDCVRRVRRCASRQTREVSEQRERQSPSHTRPTRTNRRRNLRARADGSIAFSSSPSRRSGP